MQPKRIERKRTKGWKMPKNTIYVGRPTKWGNPFRIGQTVFAKGCKPRYLKTVDDVIKAYEWWLKESNDGIDVMVRATKELKGKNLACWCKEGEPCHADVLLELANQ